MAPVPQGKVQGRTGHFLARSPSPGQARARLEAIKGGKKSHNITQNTPIIFITQSEESKDLPNLFSQRVYEKKLIFPSRRVKIPEGT